MTHDDADQPAPQPSPEDEAAVRRLLADVRETGPVPPAVAARLDDALAGLAGGRTADGAPVADVVPLAARRRRRAAALLVAAAAVVVGGVAITSHRSGDGDSASSMSADSAVSREDGSDTAAAPAQGDSGGGSLSPHGRAKASRKTVNDLQVAAPARVRPDHLVPDLEQLRRRLLRRITSSAYAADEPVTPHGFRCAPAPYGHGVLLGVRYDGGPAVVAFRTPKGDTQVVEVLQCGTGDVLRSATIPAR